MDMEAILFYLISLAGVVNGFSSGAPSDFCQYRDLASRKVGLRPGHGGSAPEAGQSTQYSLQIDSYDPTNSIYRVTLKAAPGDFFRGFFIQATRDNYPLDSQDRPAYGTFRSIDSNSQPRLCRAAVGQVGGITHTGNNNKTEVSVDFILPVGCNLGDIQFVATVVKTYSQYWVDVRSDPVSPIGFQGQRSLLCRLYYDPFNQRLQQQVLQVLRRLQMANVRQPAQPSIGAGRAQVNRPVGPLASQGLQQG
ncbi:putative ferric-chelate reductase 1 isoform X4 [Mizuhopecten yessoensis]|uniref:putative ferric-chelate reductase 1 isoform X4 n=1 Tax=Mizuhopecten yessoensis TaxID=6573 RepID=UPI000B45ED8F|nr:putative ferric-chelate reductase 1 isoform X4 [Mizuhopecten yessoensis]